MRPRLEPIRDTVTKEKTSWQGGRASKALEDPQSPRKNRLIRQEPSPPMTIVICVWQWGYITQFASSQ